ncbi:MAG: PAS domain S-box protein [Deinococcota bacterium]
MTQPEPSTPFTLSMPPGEGALYQTLFEHSADIVMLVDINGILRYQSPFTQQHLGYAHAGEDTRTSPDSLWKIVHPDDAPTLRHLIFGPLPAEVVITLPPYRVRHANGTWRWLEGTAVNLTHDPNVRGLLLKAHDVTSRVEASRRIHDFARLAETLLTPRSLTDVIQLILHEALPVLGAAAGCVALLDAEGTYLSVHGSVGYPPEVSGPWRQVPLAAPLPMTDAVRECRAVFLTEEEWDEQYPHLRRVRLPGLGSAAALPLLGQDGPSGVLNLNFPDGQAFSASEQQFMQRVASLCAHAIGRLCQHDQLARRDESYRTLTRYASEITTILAPDGTIVFETEIATRLLGYPIDELLGRHALDFVHPDDQARVADAIHAALSDSGKIVHVTYRFRHRDGHWVWLQSTGADHTHDPQVRGVLVNSRDVTGQLETELALTDQQEAFRYLFEHNPLPMWVYDLETLDFLEVNDAALRRYGYTREDFLRLKVTDIRLAEDPPEVLTSPAPQASGTPSRHITRSGHILDVLTHAHMFNFGGRTAKLIVIEDVTERLAAEHKLQESERKFRLLAENASSIIATFTPDGECTYVSPACLHLLGYTPEEYRCARPFDGVHPYDRPHLCGAFER